jgi:hypothetical protein
VQEQGKLRVVSTPEPCGIGVVERADQQFEAGPAAQRGLPGQQAAHDRHGRTAQQQPRSALLSRTARAELPLDDRWQRRTRLHQERELVDDHRPWLIPQKYSFENYTFAIAR